MGVHTSTLPRSTPEAQGVSAEGIGDFLNAWEKMNDQGRSEPHSFMLLRHGQVVAESWWEPYRPDAVHSLYSVSKSITSLAVGLAVSEGLLKITDPVTGFFLDKLPASISPNLERLRVADLLTMAVGHMADMAFVIAQQQDWVEAFLALPIEQEPGSAFVYNSAATYMLSAIIQKVTGQTLLDYLTPRLLAPLGAEGCSWESCPLGINTGGWGFSATTETVAKLGQLCLQRGMWNGKQLLPAAWLDAASGFHVQQPATWSFMGPAEPGVTLEQLQASSDYYQGYGYQFWRGRHGSYRADGALAQFMILLPDQDAVVVLTSESPDMQAVLDLVWDHLLPALNHQIGKDGIAGQNALATRLSSSRLLPPVGVAGAAMAERINGRTFAIEANTMGADSISFVFGESDCGLALRLGDHVSRISAGLRGWRDGVTDFPGTPPGLFAALRPSAGDAKMAAAAAWADENTLKIQTRFYETPHHDMLVCRFDGDRVEISFLNSVSAAFGARSGAANPFPEARPVLRGVLQ